MSAAFHANRIPAYAQLRQQLESAFNQFGASLISDERAAQLLAWLHVLGKDSEAACFVPALYADLRAAAARLQLAAGQVPAASQLPALRQYMTELEAHGWRAAWLPALLERYGLAPTRAQLAEPSPQAARAAHQRRQRAH